jgi:ABC-type polysaccharide/polyol phosphate transport system ATPase subunit
VENSAPIKAESLHTAIEKGQAIKVEGLGKCYQIYEKPRDRLAQSLWRGRRNFYREFWALQDVSFDVPRGDALGVVGRNGSGKSTLLQIICGTLSLTTGTVQVNGRVAALLELGSGFNPELTGRENVHMNATILGLSAGEIEERFDDIVAFSEIAEFLDQPIKTYSSGMTLRLAFSVAVNVDADIIVIDEALAVGDARFQLKCARAMDRLRDNGKTLVFVSHDGASIKRLCSEAILLERGRLLVRAAPNDTMNIYSKLIADERGAVAVERDIRALAEAKAAGRQGGLVPVGNVTAAEQGLNERVSLLLTSDRSYTQITGGEFSYGSELGKIEAIVVTDDRATPRTSFTTGDRMRVDLLLAVGNLDVADSIYALVIKDIRGQEIYGTNTFFQGKPTPVMRAGARFRVWFDMAVNLMPGTYFVSVGWTYFEGSELRIIHRRYDVVSLEVLPSDRSTGIANCYAAISYEAAT